MKIMIADGGRMELRRLSPHMFTRYTFPSQSSDEYNWDGDILEAYAFAFLSVRKLLNLPISFPNTTNIKKPLVGGKIFNF